MTQKLRFNLSTKLLIPLGKTYSRRRYFLAKKYQKFLEKSQYHNESILEARRFASLKKLIEHCYRNVPYYQQLMKNLEISPSDISSIEDLNKFPLLSKQLLTKNFDLLRATNVSRKRMQLVASGGTTGNPVQAYRDLRNEYRSDAALWRFWKWAGYVLGMKSVRFEAHLDELEIAKNIREKLRLFMDNVSNLNAFNLSKKNMDNYVALINQKKPEVFRGYSSAILNFTRYVRDHGIKIHKPKSIIITADKIYQKEKREISSFFLCDVFEEYGCREIGVFAHECEQHSGLHVADEDFIIEVINPSDNSLAERNEFGEIVITCLLNYAMPMIRYKLGDFGKVLNNNCTCGRKLTLIDYIEGRVADFIITKSKKRVYGPAFQIAFDNVKGISQYLIEQKEIGKINIKIIINNHFNDSELNVFKNNFNRIFSDDIEYTIEMVDKIIFGVSGKRRTVISYLGKHDLINGE